MAKTAEEILSEHLGLSVTESIPMWECAINASKEFAAQELDSYKYALKAELQSRVNGTRGLEHLSFEDIAEIIDAVK